MPTRPAVAAVLAAVAVGALAPGASARGNQSLDGTRHTRFTARASLTQAAMGDPQKRLDGDVLTPDISECASTSCDITRLNLTLPRAVHIGRFELVASMPRSLDARIAVYDARGNEVHATDATDVTSGVSVDVSDPTTYTLAISDARLPAGTYTIVVYDTGGSGQVVMNVSYQARRPDRQVR